MDQMKWFPSQRDTQNGWKFDIVSLLVILGESTIERHIQVIAASKFAAFPRLLPAPQTLLRTERPGRLPSVKDVVITGVYSGTYLTELNFFADVIHDIEALKPYEFWTYNVEYAMTDPEMLTTKRRSQTSALGVEKIINIPIKSFCALNLISLVSVLMTIGLFIWAGCIQDGVAMIAIATMSLSTSLACLSSSWYPVLSKRPTSAEVPKGDIVIVTRTGAFVVVHCTEEITRELYGGAEICRYVFNRTWHRILLGTSTVFLMASVIFFSNCGWTMQAAIGIAYIIINIMYWAIPLIMEKRETWDMSRYKIEKTCGPEVDKFNHLPSYTKTLWYAIRDTKSIEWVRNGKLAPSTDFWNKWLLEAKQAAEVEDEDWDPIEAKDRLMAEAARRCHPTSSSASFTSSSRASHETGL